jgi:hypothetical protein
VELARVPRHVVDQPQALAGLGAGAGLSGDLPEVGYSTTSGDGWSETMTKRTGAWKW